MGARFVRVLHQAGARLALYAAHVCQTAAVIAETPEERSKRHRQRVLFDRVPQLYDSSRSTYPDEIVEFMVATSETETGQAVLEIGCGTGQLTQQLVVYGFALTAIDIGPAMIAAARRRLANPAVTFEAVSFEEFDASDQAFALLVSATAFHWVDPDIGWQKAAQLLRPGGWLALLGTSEKYDDPFGSALTRMWVARSEDKGSWTRKINPTAAETLDATGLFAPAVTRTHTERSVLRADAVYGLEQTRATALSYSDDVRQGFATELQQLLTAFPEVGFDRPTSLTMAQSLRQ